MSTSPIALSFAVRIGIPGSLTIELQASPTLAPNPTNLLAPLTQPVIGTPGLGSSPGGQPFGPPASGSPSSGAQSPQQLGQLISKAWGQGWAIPVTRRLAALGGNLSEQLIGFEAPSWDQTDNLWGAQGSIDAVTDPVTLIAPLYGMSVYGRKFAVGDYVLWNDSSVVGGQYQYEIDQITAVNGATFTLSRRPKGGPPGRAAFGTIMAAHSNVKFVQLIDRTFFDFWGGERQVYKFLWDKMIVAAISAFTVGLQQPTQQLLFPIPPAAANPGLST